jgi:beta-glucosidase-like glycosyl hydrolase
MPFQAAIQTANLRSMMNAYPELDGNVVAASRAILTGLLRRELGFEGLVVSDYYAITMLHSLHRAAPDRQTAAVKALQAGIDMELPGQDCYGEPLRLALEASDISIDAIDAAVRLILEFKFGLGLFERSRGFRDARTARLGAGDRPPKPGIAQESGWFVAPFAAHFLGWAFDPDSHDRSHRSKCRSTT